MFRKAISWTLILALNPIPVWAAPSPTPAPDAGQGAFEDYNYSGGYRANPTQPIGAGGFPTSPAYLDAGAGLYANFPTPGQTQTKKTPCIFDPPATDARFEAQLGILVDAAKSGMNQPSNSPECTDNYKAVFKSSSALKDYWSKHSRSGTSDKGADAANSYDPSYDPSGTKTGQTNATILMTDFLYNTSQMFADDSENGRGKCFDHNIVIAARDTLMTSFQTMIFGASNLALGPLMGNVLGMLGSYFFHKHISTADRNLSEFKKVLDNKSAACIYSQVYFGVAARCSSTPDFQNKIPCYTPQASLGEFVTHVRSLDQIVAAAISQIPAPPLAVLKGASTQEGPLLNQQDVDQLVATLNSKVKSFDQRNGAKTTLFETLDQVRKFYTNSNSSAMGNSIFLALSDRKNHVGLVTAFKKLSEAENQKPKDPDKIQSSIDLINRGIAELKNRFKDRSQVFETIFSTYWADSKNAQKQESSPFRNLVALETPIVPDTNLPSLSESQDAMSLYLSSNRVPLQDFVKHSVGNLANLKNNPTSNANEKMELVRPALFACSLLQGAFFLGDGKIHSNSGDTWATAQIGGDSKAVANYNQLCGIFQGCKGLNLKSPLDTSGFRDSQCSLLLHAGTAAESIREDLKSNPTQICGKDFSAL